MRSKSGPFLTFIFFLVAGLCFTQQVNQGPLGGAVKSASSGTTKATTSISSLDHLLPPHTVACLGVRDLASFKEKFKQTALYDIWMDPNLKTWKSQSWPKYLNLMKEQLGFDIFKFLGQIKNEAVIAVLIRPGTNMAQLIEAPMVIILNQKGHEKAFASFVETEIVPLIKKSCNQFKTETQSYQGFDIAKMGEAPRSFIYYFSIGENFIFSFSSDVAEQIIDVHKQNSGSLLNKPNYSKMVSSIPAEANLFFWMDVNQIIKGELQTKGTGNDVLRAQQIMDDLGLLNLTFISSSMGIKDKGFVSQGMFVFDGNRKGLFDLVGSPGSLESMALVPPDTTTFIGLKIKRPLQIWSMGKAVVKNNLPPEQYKDFEKQEAKLGQTLGVNLEKDILSTFGDEIAMSGGGSLQQFYMQFMFKVEDTDRLAASLEKVLQKFNIMPLKSSYKGFSYQSFAPAMMMPMPICYGFVDKFLVVSMHQSGLEAAINTLQSKVNLANSDKFKKLVGHLPTKGVGYGFSDISKDLPQTGNMLSVMMLSAPQSPLRKILGDQITAVDMPDFNAIAKHLFGSASVITAAPDSLTLHSYSATGFSMDVTTVAVFPTLAAIAVPNFLEAQKRSKVSRVKADMRSMATALEAYYIDNGAYPAWEMSKLYGPPQPVLMCRYPSTGVHSLTTPIAYITQMMEDPFTQSQLGWFTYYSQKDGWIMVSTGPDKDYDIDPTKDYDAKIRQPSARLLLKAYDPSNGTVSGGDIFRVKY